MGNRLCRKLLIFTILLTLLSLTACTKKVEVYMDNFVQASAVRWSDGTYHVVSKIKEEDFISSYGSDLIITDMDARMTDLRKEYGNDATPAELFLKCISYSLSEEKLENDYTDVEYTWNIDKEILMKEFNCKLNFTQQNRVVGRNFDIMRLDEFFFLSTGSANGLDDRQPVSIYEADVADHIVLGRYEQDNNLSNGEEDIEWIVLKKANGKLLLVSRFALDCQPYHDEVSSNVPWEDCLLRKWLNEEFYVKAFSEGEKYLIVNAKDGEPDFSNFETGELAEQNKRMIADRVFVLSEEEMEDLFPARSGVCNWTKYAEAQCMQKTGYNWNISRFWLRGNAEKYSCFDSAKGRTEEVRIRVYENVGKNQVLKGLAVRPVIWISVGVD